MEAGQTAGGIGDKWFDRDHEATAAEHEWPSARVSLDQTREWLLMEKINRDSAGVVTDSADFNLVSDPTSSGARLPSSPASSRTTPGQILAIVCVGMILANLDLFIVNVGLPNIASRIQQSKP